MMVVREKVRPGGFSRIGTAFIGRLVEADLSHAARHGMLDFVGLRMRFWLDLAELPGMDISSSVLANGLSIALATTSAWTTEPAKYFMS